MLLRLMARLFGTAPAWLPNQVNRLSSAQLEELGEAVLDLGSYADVESWISRI